MRFGSFKPSNGPAFLTTRAVLSGSADNISINSATVIAPSPKVTPEHALHFRQLGSGAITPAAATSEHPFLRPPTRPSKPQSTITAVFRRGWDAVARRGWAQRL